MLAGVSGTYSFSCVCNTIAIEIVTMPATHRGMVCVNDSLCIIKLQSDVHGYNKKHMALAIFVVHFAVFVFYSPILYLIPVKNAVLLSLTVISPPLSDGASQHQPSGILH